MRLIDDRAALAIGMALPLALVAGVQPVAAQAGTYGSCREVVVQRLGVSASEVTVAQPEVKAGTRTVRWTTRRGDAGVCGLTKDDRVFAFKIERRASGDAGRDDDTDIAGGGSTRLLTCESRDERREECRIARGETVRLSHQLSDAECREGSTWGASSDYVWVTRGCRAEFQVNTGRGDYRPDAEYGYGEAGGPAQRACEYEASRRLGVPESDVVAKSGGRDRWGTAILRWTARRGARGTCEVDMSDRIVELRIERGLAGSDDRGAYGSGTQIVTCESRGERRAECRIPTGATVRMAEQLSETDCREGNNWGVRNAYIWVTSGCRAEFEVNSR